MQWIEGGGTGQAGISGCLRLLTSLVALVITTVASADVSVTQQPQDVKAAVEWLPANLANTPTTFTPFAVELDQPIEGGGGGSSTNTIRLDLPVKGNRYLISGPGKGTGPGFLSPWGVVLDAPNNRAIVVDSGLPGLLAINLLTGDRTVFSQSGVAGTGTAFSVPQYAVPDTANNRILVSDFGLGIIGVDLATGDRTLVSGSGTGTGPALTNNYGLALDDANNRILVAENPTGLLAVDPVTGDRVVFSSSGTGTGPDFSSALRAITIDSANDRVFVPDRDRGVIFSVNLATGDRTILSGNLGPEPGGGPNIDTPGEVVIDLPNGRLLVTENFNAGVYAIDLLTGDRSLFSGAGEIGPVLTAPWGLVADTANTRLLLVDNTGLSLHAVELRLSVGDRQVVADATHGTGGTATTEFGDPRRIALDADNHRVLVTDVTAGGIFAVDIDSGDRTEFSVNSGAGSGVSFVEPVGIELDAARNRVLVADKSLNAVIAVDTTTRVRTILSDGAHGTGTGFTDPVDLVLDVASDLVYVTDQVGGAGSGTAAVFEVDPATGDRTVHSQAGTRGAGSAFGNTGAIALDSANSRLLVGDGSASRVIAVDLATGDRSTFGPTLGDPRGLAVDVAGDRLLVADPILNEIYALDLVTATKTLIADAITAGDGPDFSFPVEPVVEGTRGRALVLDATLPALLAVDLVDPVLGANLPVSPYTSSTPYTYTETAGGIGLAFAEWANTGGGGGSTVLPPVTLTFDDLPIQLAGLPVGETVYYTVTHRQNNGTQVGLGATSDPAFTLVEALTAGVIASLDFLDASQGSLYFTDAAGDAIGHDTVVQLTSNATLNTLAQGDLVLTLRGDFAGIALVQATTAGVFTGADEAGNTAGGTADAFLVNPGQTAASAVILGGLAEETSVTIDFHFILDGSTVQAGRKFTLEADVLSATGISAPLDDVIGPVVATILTFPDSDGDGLPDDVEAALGTNPGLSDTDGDGISDFDEVNRDGNPDNYISGIDTDPNNPDSDGDGLTDGEEDLLGTNPVVADNPIRASTDSAGAEGAGSNTMSPVSREAVSGDGRYVAFKAAAGQFTEIPGSTTQIAVKDIQTGALVLASANDSGEPGDGFSEHPSISDDGRYVVFHSASTNLAPGGDGNSVSDIFRRDLQTGTTARISVDSSGTEANGASTDPAISADGRYVAFQSAATNLVTGDSNGFIDIFVRDTVAGTTVRVSTDASGGEALGGDSRYPAISANGAVVSFSSTAANLVTGDGNSAEDMFVKTLAGGAIQRASTDSLGAESDGYSLYPSLSLDGRYVVFQSAATNLVADDGNSADDVFLKDTQTGATALVSASSAGIVGDAQSGHPAVSDDGRYVVFDSAAGNLVAGDSNGTQDVFTRDMQTGLTSRVSVAGNGAQAGSFSSNPGISADGKYAVFESLAGNLVGDDANTNFDVFRFRLALTPDPDGDGLPADTEANLGTDPLDWDSDDDGLSDFDEVNRDGDPSAYTPGTGVGADTNPLSDDTDGDTLTDFDEQNRDGDPGNYTPGTDTDPNVADTDGDGLDDNIETGTGSYASATDTGTSPVNADSDGDGLTDFEELSLNGNPNDLAGVDTDPNIADTDGDGLTDGFEVLYEGGTGSGTAADYNPGVTDLDANSTDTDGDGVVDGAETALAGDPLDGAIQPGSPLRIGNTITGAEADNDSFRAVFSADGRIVAFESTATNLVPGNDTNPGTDIFIRDLQTGSITRISSDSNGDAANGTSQNPSISDDGLFVVFESSADNLVTGDIDGWSDIFLYDVANETLARISTDTASAVAGNGSSWNPRISANGRYVLFESGATNLVAVDTNNRIDVFLKDLQLDTTVLVSTRDGGGVQTNEDSFLGQSSGARAISSDGVYAAFQSRGSNIVSGDGGTGVDVFVKNLLTDAILMASTDSAGTVTGGSDNSELGGITPDGRYVVFSTYKGLVPEDTGGWGDIYVKDLVTGLTTRISTDSTGMPGAQDSLYPVISADGRYVAFESGAQLVSDDLNAFSDIYVKDTVSGVSYRLSEAADGTGGNGNSFFASISADGRYAGFYSSAANLVAGDSNGVDDAFRAEIPPDTDADGLPDSEETGIFGTAPNLADTDGDGLSDRQEVGFDGDYTAYDPYHPVTNPTGTDTDATVADTDGDGVLDGAEQSFGGDPLDAGVVPSSPLRASVTSTGDESVFDKFTSAISQSGDYVAFHSAASDLVAGDNNGSDDVFVKNINTGRLEMASTDSAGIPGNAASRVADISSDGQRVVFESDADNLAAGDTNAMRDVFLKDTAGGLPGTTTLVSADTGGGPADNASGDAVITDDGMFVAFESLATDLVANDLNLVQDIFLRDIAAGTTIRVSTDSAGNGGNGASQGVAMTPDAQVIAFRSQATNLDTTVTDSNGTWDIFVKNLQTGVATRVSTDSAGNEANGPSFDAVISADANFVFFASDASNLVPGDSNGVTDIFMKDIVNGTTTRLSVTAHGDEIAGSAYGPVVSGDGRFVAFALGVDSIHVKDVLTGALTRMDVDKDGVAGSGFSSQPDITADGRYVAFDSSSDDLVAGDSGFWDIFRNEYNAPPYVDPDINDTAGDSYATTFIWDSAGTTPVPVVSPNVEVLDPHSTRLQEIAITLNNPAAGDLLFVDTTGGPVPGGITVDSTGTSISLKGLASIADYKDALGKIRYDITAFSTDYTPRRIAITATDEAGQAGNTALTAVDLLVNGVDLEVDTSAVTELVEAGSFDAEIIVHNHGTAAAVNVVFSFVLPAGAGFTGHSSSEDWDCVEVSGIVLCSLDTLASAASSTVTLSLTSPAGSGTLSLQAAVTSSDPDANPVNETVTATTAVVDYGGGGFQYESSIAAPAGTGAGLGTSVAMDNGWLAAGQPATPNNGRVVVQARGVSGWATPQAEVVLELPEAMAEFGSFGLSLAMQDGILVIGAPDISGAKAGKVYIYELDTGGTTWNLAQTLMPSIPAVGDEFGFSLALDGNLLAIGTPAAAGGGKVILFQRDPNAVSGGWSEARVFSSLATSSGAGVGYDVRFGHAVALQDSTLLIGAPQTDTGSDRGQVFWCRLEGTACNGFTELVNPFSALADQFGFAVAIDGNAVAVGAPDNFVPPTWPGSVFMFDYDGLDITFAQELQFSNATLGEKFGTSIALRDDVLVAGAPFAATPQADGARSGSAFVFQRDGSGNWTERQRLEDPAETGFTTAADQDMLGVAVAIDSTFIVAGGPGVDDVGPDAGIVYVYTTTSEIRLDSPAGGDADSFGLALDIGGTTLAVGARYVDVANCPFVPCGVVYLYERNGTEWLLDATIDYTDAGAADDAEFGGAVAVDGDTLLIGAPYDDTVNANDAGAAYVFTRTGGIWALQQKLHAEGMTNDPANDRFGAAVALDGDVAVIGAPDAESVTGESLAGSACVFERVGSVWGIPSGMANNLVVGPDTDGGDRFGTSVTISGDIIVAGAPHAVVNLTGADVDRGVAYTFLNTSGSWAFEAELGGDDGLGGDTLPDNGGGDQTAPARLGASVAYDAFGNGLLVVGAPDGLMYPSSEVTGRAFGFLRQTPTTWPLADEFFTTDVDGLGNQEYGTAVAIRNDTAIVGVPGDGERGTSAGAAFLWQADVLSTAWQELGKLTANDATYDDRYGSAVAIGLDARVVGAPGAPAGGNRGAVYVYNTVTVVPTVPGGVYNSTQSVSFECSNCLKVFYTTDGSTPSQTGGTADPGTLTWDPASQVPIVISTNTTLQYFSVDAALKESTLVSGVYVIDTIKPTVTVDAGLTGVLDIVGSISGTVDDGAGGGILAVQVQIQVNDGSGNYIHLDSNGGTPSLTTTPVWLAVTPVGTDWDLPILNEGATFVDGTNYVVNVRAIDNGLLVSDTQTASFTYYAGNVAFTTLGLTLASTSILLDGNTDITMNLDEPGNPSPQLAGLGLDLVITPPSGAGNQVTITCTTDSLGVAQLDDLGLNPQNHAGCTPAAGVDFDEPGTWTLQARFNADGSDFMRLPSDSPARTLTVGTSAGYAVLVQGHLEISGVNEGLAEHNKTANRIYRTLLDRGFDADNIWYFNPDPNQDGSLIDPDNGNPAAFVGGIDGLPTQANIMSVLTEPASTIGSLAEKVSNAPAPVYIIEVSHGDPDVFYNDAVELGGYTDAEVITPSELKGWLTTLQGELDTANGGLAANEPLIAVLGMCYSGSAIGPSGDPESLSADGIYVITSADEGELSYRGGLEPDGIRVGEYFLEEFFQHAGRGFDLAESFEYATAVTETFTRRDSNSGPTGPYNDEAVQHPLVDTNADGVGSNELRDPTATEPKPDGLVLQNLFLGVGPTILTNSPDSPADIVAVTPTRFLADGVDTTILHLQANDDQEVEQAWVEVRSPVTEYLTSSGTVQVAPVLNKQQLLSPATCQASFGLTGVWCAAIGGFSAPGTHEVFYFVQDVGVPASGIEGRISPAQRSLVYRNQAGNAFATTGEPVSVGFELLTPADGTATPTVLMLDWSPSFDADGLTYTLEIATDSLFSNVVFTREEITASNLLVDETTGLQNQSTYYWRVTAVDSLGEMTVATHADTGNPYGSYTTDNNSNAIPGVIFTTLRESLNQVALEGATVGVAEGTSSLEVYDEGNGEYTLVVQPAGLYTVQASLSGYASGSLSGVDATTDPSVLLVLDPLGDTDGDGLDDVDEANIYGTDPNNVDTDGDGLTDGAGGVVSIAGYPGGVDSDGDGFVDGEQDFGNDPTVADYADGLIAPWGAPDTTLDLGDYLVAVRIVNGDLVPAAGAELQQVLGHIDMNADGVIDAADLVQLLLAIEAQP